MKKLKRSISKRIMEFTAKAVNENLVKLVCRTRSKNRFCDISLSQHGQDVFVKNYFAARARKERYVFVDIGANDGLNISNTYMLEHAKEYPSIGAPQNWGGGVLIEADPAVFEKLLKNRPNPNIAKYNIAVCENDCEVEFMQISGGAQMLSGIASEYSKEHRERVQREAGKENCRIVKVQGMRLSSILKNHPDINEIDYLSIDVEGGEMAILRSIDFDDIPIQLLGIEDAYPESSGIVEFMEGKGYRKICRLGCDVFFERV